MPDQDPARIVDGRISMDVEILAVTGIDFEAPVNDPEITPGEVARGTWAYLVCELLAVLMRGACVRV